MTLEGKGNPCAREYKTVSRSACTKDETLFTFLCCPNTNTDVLDELRG